VRSTLHQNRHGERCSRHSTPHASDTRNSSA
jgi:hypothetical protein